MDWRSISLDRVQFDTSSGTKLPIRYGSERQIRVQTPRMRVRVSHHSFGTRLSLAQAHACAFSEFLKSIELAGCHADHVDIDLHPMEQLYLNEDTICFDHMDTVIETEACMTVGAVLDVACIVAIDGLFVTRSSDGDIIKARLSIAVEQVKVYTEKRTREPDVYVNGVKQETVSNV